MNNMKKLLSYFTKGSKVSFFSPNYISHPDLVNEDEVCYGFRKEEFKRRREELLDLLGEGSAVSIGAFPIREMAMDVPYPYRTNSNLFYLTGAQEPLCHLVMKKSSKGVYDECLIVFDDVSDYGLTLCNPLGVELSKEVFGIEKVFKQGEDVDFIDESDEIQVVFLEGVEENEREKNLSPYIMELRKVKSEAEIKMLQEVADITEKAFRSTMKFCCPGINEKEIENYMEYEMKKEGAQRFSFIPVIAGGDRANMIHYILNNQVIDDGELVLIDGGAEIGMYLSDITRTFPVNGKFSEEQKTIYEIVLEANKECIKQLKEGKVEYTSELDSIAEEVLADGLLDKGVCRDVPKEYVKENLGRLMIHSVTHFMGIDVHERGSEEIVPNCVFTVEPGLYLSESKDFSDFGIDEKYYGISVRIEDNIVYQGKDSIVLSQNIPKEIEEIEQVMKN